MNFYLTIPNIVISTLNGSITMSLNTLFPTPDEQKTATTIIGLISLFSAILITLNQYIKSQQMAEAHNAASLTYSKLYRTIMNELSLRRDQRTNGLDFLKYVRGEIDRLESSDPHILPFAIQQFNIKFHSSHIEKPELTGDLDPLEINTETESTESTQPITIKDTPQLPDPEPSPNVLSTFSAITRLLNPFPTKVDTAPIETTNPLTTVKDTTPVVVDMGTTPIEKDELGYVKL